MNNKILSVLAFSLGAAVGSVVTWKLLKDKYEKIANDEIESVKAVFSERKRKADEARQEKEKYEALLDSYITHEDDIPREEPLSNFKQKGGPDIMEDKPYVIPPEEFGDFSDYEMINLTYYADGILANDMDEMVDHVETIVGLDSLEHFGEYEADTVFVRNDKLKADYEICRDLRRFSAISYAENLAYE